MTGVVVRRSLSACRSRAATLSSRCPRTGRVRAIASSSSNLANVNRQQNNPISSHLEFEKGGSRRPRSPPANPRTGVAQNQQQHVVAPANAATRRSSWRGDPGRSGPAEERDPRSSASSSSSSTSTPHRSFRGEDSLKGAAVPPLSFDDDCVSVFEVCVRSGFF